jgi:Flp pilus assembly pilin Flp
MHFRSWGNWVRDECGQTTVEYAVVVATTVVLLAIFLAVMPSDPFGQFWSFLSSAL